ncbi:hypothetical protein IQ07DRAFT_21612 [Pyrenochaeta sp. DS3sAY3a]|nr:hypothetical protein IQ07DRAFT_21612 [Pyrenochaeta sp. DS3sAY3a]
MREGWTVVQPGVQIWQPQAEEEMGRLSLNEDYVPRSESSSPTCGAESIEIEPKIEQTKELADFEDVCSTTSSSTAVGTPQSSSSSSSLAQIVDQLQTLIKQSGNPYDHEGTATINDGDSDNESTRTDFLVDRESPSVRGLHRTRPRIQEARRDRDRTSQRRQNEPVIRRLDFSTSRVTKKKPQKASALEYSPRRRWSAVEHQFLCVLNRWYGHNAQDFASIFNEAFGLDLPMSKIRGYYQYLRYFGKEALPVYGDVFSTPFKDPHGRYAQIRQVIELTAENLGIELEKLSKEELSPSGKAKTSKSPKIKKAYKSLVTRAGQDNEDDRGNAKESSAHVQALVPTRLGGFALTVNASVDDSEHWSDVEDESRPTAQSDTTVSNSSPAGVNSTFTVVNNTPSLQSDPPQLAFRVWDENSRAKFDPKSGFTSEAHALWNGPLLPPFSFEEEGLRATMLMLNQHLSMESETPSYFISVSTSLLASLSKASGMTNPFIAIIDMRHPHLKEEPNKILHVEPCLRWLKSNGQAQWARYKGSAEWVIWGRLDAPTVLHTFSLEKLISICYANPVCNSIMGLETFQAGRQVRDIATLLRRKKTELCPMTARALGMIGRVFGLHEGQISLQHIACFVSKLIDGFYINSPSMSLHERSNIASSFAIALNSHQHLIQAIMGAFLDGVEEGQKSIAYYSRGRRGIPQT